MKIKYTSNFLEDAISFLNPSAGLKRAQKRFQLDLIRKYDAASQSPRTKNWQADSTSVNIENVQAFPRLRDRSRDLVRNNAYAKKATQVLANIVVGTGIRPKFSAKSATEKKRIVAAWKAWAETTECDFDDQLNFYGLELLLIRAKSESGEVMIRRRRVGKSGVLPIQLQVVEADLLDSSRTEPAQNGGRIVQGVEYDSNGKKVAYWMFDQHPNDNLGFLNYAQSRRIPKEDIIHVYEVLRPGQVRGVPDGVSGMIPLRDFDEYEDAQLMRQKIAACFAVFIHNAPGEDPASGISGDDEEDDGTISERVQPGLIEHLTPGKTISFANPPGTEGYGEYAKNVLRKYAASMGLTYESVTGDLSNVNFTSYKAGQIPQQLQAENMQYNVMIPALNKIFKWFIEAGVLAGKFRDEEATASWTPPRREMVDPVKEIAGMSAEVRNGFTSWQEAVASRGWDADELLQELVKEAAMFEEFKLMLACDPRFDANRTGATLSSKILTGDAVPHAPAQVTPPEV
jgi:lambda family phage portal protein